MRTSTLAVGLLVFVASVASADWIQMDPPPDTDKPDRDMNGKWPDSNDNSCWQATAANMLAGAGYGTSMGTTPQQRAEGIYGQLVAHYGLGGGWSADAIRWWLKYRNDDPGNDADLVMAWGHKSLAPWRNPDAGKFVANWLRAGQQAGLGISWAHDFGFMRVAWGSHAITAWGDNGHNSPSPLSGNPSQVKVANSDSDRGGSDVETYNQAYKPGALGNALYMDYTWSRFGAANEAYLRRVELLLGGGNHIATGSVQITQDSFANATDLHYTAAATGVDIRTYKTDIDWPGKGTRTVTEDLTKPGGGEIAVDWAFDSSVGMGQTVTITALLSMDDASSMVFKDVGFTYPLVVGILKKMPDHRWDIDNLAGAGDIYGAYIIGSYELVWDDPELGLPTTVSGRLIQQFDMSAARERHLFSFLNAEAPDGASFVVTELEFAYSDGYLTSDELWGFRDWMVSASPNVLLGPGERLDHLISFPTLPYYPGVDYIGGGLYIPEPATMAMLGLAVAGLGGYVKRRRRLA